MNQLKPQYKSALADAPDAFDEKYRGLIANRTAVILDQYLFDASSDLANILRVAMRKFVLGADVKVGAFSDWFDQHATGASNDLYPLTLSGLYEIVNRSDCTPELHRLINIERGRYLSVRHTLKLIEGNSQDIGTDDGAYKVLGSLIKHAVRVHFLAEPARGLLMGVAPDYDSAIEGLEQLCERSRRELSCSDGLSASL